MEPIDALIFGLYAVAEAIEDRLEPCPGASVQRLHIVGPVIRLALLSPYQGAGCRPPCGANARHGAHGHKDVPHGVVVGHGLLAREDAIGALVVAYAAVRMSGRWTGLRWLTELRRLR